MITSLPPSLPLLIPPTQGHFAVFVVDTAVAIDKSTRRVLDPLIFTLPALALNPSIHPPRSCGTPRTTGLGETR